MDELYIYTESEVEYELFLKRIYSVHGMASLYHSFDDSI